LPIPRWPKLNCDIAHISGEKPAAARYDAAMTDDERRDFANLMLLCPNHHRLIDSLEVEAHPVTRLAEMKAKHEEHCTDARSWASEEDLDRYVDLAIEAARASSPTQAQQTRPELVLRKDGQAVFFDNRGSADAVDITIEPLGAEGDESDLLRAEEPPDRLSPGGSWRAGLHIQTFGDHGPRAVRVTYHSDDGQRFVGEFSL
jgi:hypothetical protein